MRKAGIKRDLAYFEGLFKGLDITLSHIDNLILQSNHYRENEKLLILRSHIIELREYSIRMKNKYNNKLNS